MEAIKAISNQTQLTWFFAIRKQLGDLSINWHWWDWLRTPGGVQVSHICWHPIPLPPFPPSLVPSSPCSLSSALQFVVQHVFSNRACSDIAITPGGHQKLNSGAFDFGFGNDLGDIGTRWSKPDPVGGENLLHQGGWSPISAPLNLLSSPLPSLHQHPPVLSPWPSTSLKAPDPPSWLAPQTFLPITTNQVARLWD